MKHEMVEVILFEDGTYEVKDIPSVYATQRLCGVRNGQSCDIYHCYKSKWKEYLLKLLSTNQIDKQIEELQKRKKKLTSLKEKISKELKREVSE